MKYCIKKKKRNISVFFVIILFLNFFNYFVPSYAITLIYIYM